MTTHNADTVRSLLWERLEMSKWIRGEAVPPVDVQALRAAIIVAEYVAHNDGDV